MIPPSSDRIDKRLSNEWRALSPPMWSLGVHEVMAGDVLRNAPRAGLTPRRKARADTGGLGGLRPAPTAVSMLARRAGTVSLLTAFLTVMAYWWNSRRFPSAGPLRPVGDVDGGRLGIWRAGHRPRPDGRAGFFFTLAAVWRSSLHRLTIACAGAAGVAAAMVTLSGLDLRNHQSGRADESLRHPAGVLWRSAGGLSTRHPGCRRNPGQLGIPARLAVRENAFMKCGVPHWSGLLFRR